MSSDTVPLEVHYDSNAVPTRVEYFHTTLGLVKFTVEDGVATVDPEWSRLSGRDVADGFDQWVTTGDVFRSVEQLPFVEDVSVEPLIAGDTDD